MAKRVYSTRERILIFLGVATFFSIVILQFARGLAHDYRETRRELAAASSRLSDATQLRHIIQEERTTRELMAERMGRDERFSLYDFMQSSLTRAGLADRMRLEKRGAASQSVEVVNVSLQGVGLAELTDFLHAAYGGGRPVALQQLDFLRPARDGKGLDCSMTLMSPRV